MKKLLWSALLVLCLLALAASGAPGELRGRLTPAAKSPDAPGLLQFTSAGHVLGFAPEAVYAAGGSHMYRVEFIGAALPAPVADSAPSRTGQPGPLSRVTYPDLWAGITLTYDAPAGTLLRSTYRLEPQADPAAIRLRYNVPVRLESDGTLALAYASGWMRESAPVAWQEIGRLRVPVQVAFRLRVPQNATEAQEVGFAPGAYDPAYPLFIDPMLTWSTFLGGSGDDEADSIAVDGNGNVYVTGFSEAAWQGTNPPVRGYTAGADTYVARLDSSGALVWNTFLGGSGDDYEGFIAVDGNGNVYVAGSSSAAWQGTHPPVRGYSASQDGFVARLDGSSGGLTWLTFLGGSGYDYCSAIAVDGSGNVYAAGTSEAAWQGTNPPVQAYTAGADAFAAKLDSSGGLTWSTFLGGSGSDEGHGIALVGSGTVVVAGQSSATWQGPNPPVRAYTASVDAFAAKLDSGGGLTWSTFLGGSGIDFIYGLVAVGSGDVVVAGQSSAAWQGPNLPVRAYSASVDAFAVKLDSSGGLTWNTFLGGSGADDSWAVAVDGSGSIYVAGRSDAAWGVPVLAYSAGSDAFAARLDGSGRLAWNAFLGGSGADSGYAIAVDGSGHVVLGGRSNASWGSPIRGYTDSGDAFVVKLPPYYFLFLPLVVR